MPDSLLTYLIEACFGSIFLYIYYLIFWKNHSSFHAKRYVLLSILILSSVFPLFHISTSSDLSIAGSFSLDEVMVKGSESEVTTGSNFKYALIPLMIYAAGLIVSLIAAVGGLFKILNIRRAHKAINKGDHKLIRFRGKYPTFSFLNTIYWNEGIELNDEDSQMVYSHELSHIKEYHSIDMILFSLSRIIFWFNPILHYMYREMALVHECIADKEVVRTHSPVNYLSLLANQTIYNMQYQWINQFASVSSLKRIRAIKSANRSKTLLRLFVFVPVLALLFTVVSCENSTETAENLDNSKQAEIVQDAEEMPSFVGGMEAMISYLSNSLSYPESAKNAEIEGKVFVTFVVEKDGSVTNAEVVKGVSEDLDAEALRVVESMPKWEPAKKDGETVRAKMTLPVAFKL